MTVTTRVGGGVGGGVVPRVDALALSDVPRRGLKRRCDCGAGMGLGDAHPPVKKQKGNGPARVCKMWVKVRRGGGKRR